MKVETLADGSFQAGDWHIRVHKGGILSSDEVSSLAKDLHFKSTPEMVFGNSLRFEHAGGVALSFGSRAALGCVIPATETGQSVAVGAAEVWKNKDKNKEISLTEVVYTHDWTFTSTYIGDIEPGTNEAAPVSHNPGKAEGPGRADDVGAVTTALQSVQVETRAPSSGSTDPANNSDNHPHRNNSSSSSNSDHAGTNHGHPHPHHAHHIPPHDPRFGPGTPGLVDEAPLCKGNAVPSGTHRINIARLTARDPILLFDDVTLFEDELHDHGLSSCSVKFRVMPTCFLILLRYWLRVDNVLIRV